MAIFHDDCSDVSNWTNVTGEFTSDGTDINVSSWHSISELSAIAQAYIHMFDDDWTLQSDFDFTVSINTLPVVSISDTFFIYLEFGDLSADEWAFWNQIKFGFGSSHSNGPHTIRCKLRVDGRNDYYIDTYVNDELVMSTDVYSIRNYLIKDARLQIRHYWGKWI